MLLFGSAKNYRPGVFFVLTYIWTWLFLSMAAFLSYYYPQMSGVQLFFILLGAMGPGVTALILISGSNKQKHDFCERLRLHRINKRYLPVILFLMPVVLFTATAISVLLGHSCEQFALANDYDIMTGNFYVSLMLLLFVPIVEEIGWRGYGVDSLVGRFNLFTATLFFGFLWAFWHLPLFFIYGHYNNILWHTNLIYVVNWFAQVFVISFIMNWLYYKNNRSITALIIFHFMVNLFSVLFATTQYTKCIITTLFFIIACLLVMQDKNFFLK